jgi:hypothetical protein
MPAPTTPPDFEALQLICEQQIQIDNQIRIQQGTAQFGETDNDRSNVILYFNRLKHLHRFFYENYRLPAKMWDYLATKEACFAIIKPIVGNEDFNSTTSKFMDLTRALDNLKTQILADKVSPETPLRFSLLIDGIYLTESLIKERQEFLNLKTWNKSSNEKVLNLHKKVFALGNLIQVNADIIQNPGFVDLPPKLGAANATMLMAISPNEGFYENRNFFRIVSASTTLLSLALMVAFAPVIATGSAAAVSLIIFSSVMLSLSVGTFLASTLSYPDKQEKLGKKIHDTVETLFFKPTTAPASSQASPSPSSTGYDGGMTFSRGGYGKV